MIIDYQNLKNILNARLDMLKKRWLPDDLWSQRGFFENEISQLRLAFDSNEWTELNELINQIIGVDEEILELINDEINTKADELIREYKIVEATSNEQKRAQRKISELNSIIKEASTKMMSGEFSSEKFQEILSFALDTNYLPKNIFEFNSENDFKESFELFQSLMKINSQLFRIVFNKSQQSNGEYTKMLLLEKPFWKVEELLNFFVEKNVIDVFDSEEMLERIPAICSWDKCVIEELGEEHSSSNSVLFALSFLLDLQLAWEDMNTNQGKNTNFEVWKAQEEYVDELIELIKQLIIYKEE